MRHTAAGNIMKKIAAINDISGFGKCSLTAAIPVISALGVQCCPLVTGIYSNQTEYESYYMLDFTEHMKPYLDEWKKRNAHFDAILSGYISCAKQGEIISDMIDNFSTDNTVVVIDPVMGDNGRIYPNYSVDCISAVKKLAEKANIITPNLTELCLLCESKYEELLTLDDNELFESIRKMSQCFCLNKNKAVITTGIHIKGSKTANAVFENGKLNIITTDTVGGSFSGTGDIFSSFIAAQAVKGIPLKKAVSQASEFIYKSIKATVDECSEGFDRNDGIHFEKYLSQLGDLC